MIASYLLDATRSSHPLEDLALEHAGYKALSEEDVCGRGAKAVSFRAIPRDTALNYAGERADLALQLDPVLHRADPPGSAGAALPRAGDAAHPGARRRRAGGDPHRRAGALGAVAARRAGAGDAQRADLRDGRRGVQHQLAAAAVAHSLRQAAAADPQAQHQDEDGVDRGRGARGAGADARHAAADPRVAGAAEAQGHLHRRAAAARQPRDRPRPHLLQPGGRRDRAVEQQRSEPAEHPDPHRARTRDPRGVHRRAWQRADFSGLFADRAARARAPLGRRGAGRRLHAGHRHPRSHRGEGLRREQRDRRARAAPAREDHQLRAALRKDGVHAGEGHRRARRRRRRNSSTPTSRASRRSAPSSTTCSPPRARAAS